MIVVDGVRGDMILSATLRSDLAPIPFTFEGTIRTTAETAAQFKDSALITVNQTAFRIVKSLPTASAAGVMADKPFSGVHVTAFADGLQALALPRTTAAIFENVALAGAFRACGASVPMKGDFTLDQFACYIGEIPTFALARVMQEEGVVVMWRAGSLQAMGYRELFAQTPIDEIDLDSSESIFSAHLLADQIPVYYSIAPDGQIITAPRTDAAQKLAYVPGKSQRALNNMGRVLVNRKSITGKVNPSIRAGDMLVVKGVPMVVMTVAQVIDNGSDGGPANQYTRVWLGVLS
ncbi:hypothetical protein PQR05_29525 [Paraburkholderia sediminicola]|uniref:hypothetical protein n=1 Tax=Paraburkholderia sediminicola TaxID=458836 RepID=UPI0038BD78B8